MGQTGCSAKHWSNRVFSKEWLKQRVQQRMGQTGCSAKKGSNRVFSKDGSNRVFSKEGVKQGVQQRMGQTGCNRVVLTDWLTIIMVVIKGCSEKKEFL
jgi:hypothetical protein